jgi:hypothetical protein
LIAIINILPDALYGQFHCTELILSEISLNFNEKVISWLKKIDGENSKLTFYSPDDKLFLPVKYRATFGEMAELV